MGYVKLTSISKDTPVWIKADKIVAIMPHAPRVGGFRDIEAKGRTRVYVGPGEDDYFLVIEDIKEVLVQAMSKA